MESKSVGGESSGNIKLPRIAIRKELHSLIETVKKIQLVTTYEELLDGLKVYIWEKKLYDPKNPFKICCRDDELGSVLGVKEFTIFDVKSFLQRLAFPVDKISKDSEDSCHLHSASDSALKRKNDENFDSGPKKACNADVSSRCSSPMILHIPESPVKYDNSSDSAQSIQGYETAYVKDTSDDLLSLESDDYLSCSERIVAIEETYNLEYEVESDSSSCTTDSGSSDSDSVSEIHIDEVEALDAKVLTLICRTDSDIEFFADDSSEAESEIPESDHWKCKKCNSTNEPTMRHCSRCWDERLEWLPDKTEPRLPPRKKRKQKRAKNSKDCAKIEESSSSSMQGPSTLQEDSTNEQSSFKLCIICCTRPANASVIHGKYAHQFSCYQCARKLQKKKKRCPICRRTIDRVVHQIVTCI